MPSKTIVDFANQVKSYALGIKDQQVLGAWNFLPLKEVTAEDNGITFTVNKDSNGNVISITANGTANDDATFRIPGEAGAAVPAYANRIVFPLGSYVFNGCPANGSLSTYYLELVKSVDSSTRNIAHDDFGDGVSFVCDADTNRFDAYIRIKSGITVSNLEFKPMVSIKGGSYVPYAMTNQELSEVKVVNASYTGASSTIKDISLDVQRVGKVVQFAIYFVTNTSINAGATAELTLVNCPLPSYSGVRIIGFSGTYELIGWIESTGKVKIRFFGNTNANSSIVLTGTYLTND